MAHTQATLDAMRRPAIVDLCNANGIKIPNTADKGDLIALLLKAKSKLKEVAPAPVAPATVVNRKTKVDKPVIAATSVAGQDPNPASDGVDIIKNTTVTVDDILPLKAGLVAPADSASSLVADRTAGEVTKALKLLDRSNTKVRRLCDGLFTDSDDSDEDEDRCRKKRRMEKDPLLLAIEQVFGLDPADVREYREAWSTSEFLLTPALWFRMFCLKPLVWNIDMVEGSTTLEGVLVRQIRALLEQRFENATRSEINTVLSDWRMAYQLYLSAVQLAATAKADLDWLAFFDRHRSLHLTWKANINALVDEGLKAEFGDKAVTALQASRNLRRTDLPAGEREMLEKLAKRLAAQPATTSNGSEEGRRGRQDRSNHKGGRSPITACIGCGEKVVGPVGVFFSKHNAVCKKPKRK